VADLEMTPFSLASFVPGDDTLEGTEMFDNYILLDPLIQDIVCRDV